MLISTFDVLTALDEYGIRDITSPDPIIGLKGVIREGALFITTHFDFLGEKQDPLQMYAFPRNGIENVQDGTIPTLIFEAQIELIVEVLNACGNIDGVTKFGKSELIQWVGTLRSNERYSTDAFYLKLKNILAPLLTTQDSQSFIVK